MDGNLDILKQPLPVITKKRFPSVSLHNYVLPAPAVDSSSDSLRPPLRPGSTELLHAAAGECQKQWEKKNKPDFYIILIFL